MLRRKDEEAIPRSADDPGGYLDLAREIRERVRERLGTPGGEVVDLDDVFRTVLGEVEHEELEAQVRVLVAELSPAEKLALLSRLYGEAEIDALLRRATAADKWQLERQARLEDLRRDVVISRMVDLEKVDVGEVLEIGMFNASGGFEQRAQANRIITARVREQPGAHLQRINEQVRPPALSAEAIDPVLVGDDVFQLGTSATTADGELFEPTVTYGSQTVVRLGDGTRRSIPQRVGYVLVGETVVLNKPVI